MFEANGVGVFKINIIFAEQVFNSKIEASDEV